MPKDIIYAVAYERYSCEKQNDGFSIEAQQLAINEYADENGITIVQHFIDEAKTGRNANRDGLNNMMYYIEANEHIELVLCHKRDRLFRNKNALMNHMNKFEEFDVDLVAVAQDYGSTKEGRMMLNITDALAEYYSENLAEEVRKAARVKALKGLHNGGKPPLGLSVDDNNTYIINEAEAPIIRKLFQLYADGKSMTQIVKIFNDKGYKTKNNRAFGKNSLHELLKNPKMCGTYVYNKRMSKKSNGCCNSHKSKNEDEIVKIEDSFPAIVSKELFEKVQVRMENNKRNAGAHKSKNGQYLFTSKIVCGECGYRFQGNSRKSHNGKNVYTSYRCGNREQTRTCSVSEIERLHLEEFVIKKLTNSLFNKSTFSYIKSQLEEYMEKSNSQNNDEIKVLNKRLKGVQTKIDNITSAIANGFIQKSMIEQLNVLEENKSQIENSILLFKEKGFVPTISEKQFDNAIKMFEEFVLNNKDDFDVQMIISKFLDKIVVYNSHIEVSLIAVSIPFGGRQFKMLITISSSRDEIMGRFRMINRFSNNLDNNNRIKTVFTIDNVPINSSL